MSENEPNSPSTMSLTSNELTILLKQWQERNMAEATRLLRGWAKRYCALDSPKTPAKTEDSERSEDAGKKE
jgi:hypothetical protein